VPLRRLMRSKPSGSSSPSPLSLRSLGSGASARCSFGWPLAPRAADDAIVTRLSAMLVRLAARAEGGR
jgi:hypothetical protein